MAKASSFSKIVQALHDVKVGRNFLNKKQNLQDAVKTGLKGKFIRLNAYSEREERSPMNNLTLHHQELEKINFEKINKTDKHLATLASQKRKGERQRERERERGRDDSNYEIKNESEDITAYFTEVKKDYKRLL